MQYMKPYTILLSLALSVVVFAEPMKVGDTVSEPIRGMERIALPEVAAESYPKRWAVIVGINYTGIKIADGARTVLPPLSNAENDAQAVADLLIKHYGYEKDCLKLLKGKDATREAIQDALSGGFLAKKSQVGEKDSVLFFFAGHGYHLKKDMRAGELLPWDVKLEGDIPIQASCIPLEDQVVKFLQSSTARHKLVILDCCHSGDIFTRSQQANRRLSPTLRADVGLFHTPAFQAVASCRREQQASDGKGGHAPFTASMLSALTVIPRQQGTRDPLKASDLFTFMQAELRSAPAIDQSAELGWLTPDQGEFHFFPDPKSDFSGYSSHTDDEMLKAIAMAPGTYGAWWFDEMPWFMPSLRSRILANVEKPRSTSADWVKKHQLEKSAREILRAMEREPGALALMRVRHLTLLLDRNTRQDPSNAYKQIANELREPPEGIVVEASDLHLLALIEHRVGTKAREVYAKAVTTYEAGFKAGRKEYAALRLLCLADLGQFEFQEHEYEQAALEYQRALEQRVLCPVPFQIYVLCCEADAWRGLGRWGETDAKLSQVLRLAIPLAEQNKESPLTAYAFARRAWGYMDQWKFKEAAESFVRADEHLPREHDREAALIRFHNGHGIAMARRFTGDPEGALADYRRLSNDIRVIINKLRQDPGVERNYGEIRERLYVRLQNTLERQADCNLFSSNGDLKEASDDLRRALRVTDHLTPSSRNSIKAMQLYKQALALGKRSQYQDLELAARYLQDADVLTKLLTDEQQRQVDYYRKLATALVQMATDLRAAEEELGAGVARREKTIAAMSGLRKVINELRPMLNRSIHRDNLEVLLFATQCLILEDLAGPDRYALLTDAELLLILCRHAMRSEPMVTQRYLRHYLDSVIRAMLAARPKHVQGIIEAVSEARMGRQYDKPVKPAPCLVIYHLDGRFHAFLDVPHGTSKSYLFDESLTVETLREAASTRKLLPLPRQLGIDLANLKFENAYFPESLPDKDADLTGSLHIRWFDSCYHFGRIAPDPVIASEFNAGSRSSRYPPLDLIHSFPFALPGIKLPEASPANIVPPPKE